MDFFSSVFFVRANFVLVQTIIQIKVKPFLIEYPLSYYWKPFSTRLYIYMKAVFFGVVKTIFLKKNPS